jgi:hypothetical protein
MKKHLEKSITNPNPLIEGKCRRGNKRYLSLLAKFTN